MRAQRELGAAQPSALLRRLAGLQGPPPGASVAAEAGLATAARTGASTSTPLVTPMPPLVDQPRSSRQLPVVGRPEQASICWLVAAHGGAGATSVLRAGVDAVAADGGRSWPARGAVVLVARTSTSGLEWARDAARQHAAGAAGDRLDLLGLVLVADAPGRLPSRTAALADLVCGAFPRVWQVPWLEEWRLASHTERLPTHPEVKRLTKDLQALTGARARPGGEAR